MSQFNTDVDIVSLYPDSTSDFVCEMIQSPEGGFEENYTVLIEEYRLKGAVYIYYMRESEWEKVMVRGEMEPW